MQLKMLPTTVDILKSKNTCWPLDLMLGYAAISPMWDCRMQFILYHIFHPSKWQTDFEIWKK